MKLGEVLAREKDLADAIKRAHEVLVFPSNPRILVLYLTEALKKWEEELHYVQEDLHPFREMEMPVKELPN